MMSDYSLQTRCLSSLSKVFADEELRDARVGRASALRNERFSYQVAYRSEALLKPLSAGIISDLAPRISVRAVGLVPSELPCREDHDDDVLRTTPGLYPDPLYPPRDGIGFAALPGQWRSLWVTVDLDESVDPGTYPIEIRLMQENGEVAGAETFELEVIATALPPQRLIHTEWFHVDCIAAYYREDVWSERLWELLGQYIRTAVRNGMNMLLTPLFTPPLDTEIGGERTTVQLVDVERIGDGYRFGFDKLQRWVELCLSNGVEYFEFSHLFTQWGAKHAPKIMGTENGAYKRLFGWETDAGGAAYRSFLDAFLPELVAFLERGGLKDRSYFHVSDEPAMEALEDYRTASGIIRGHLAGFPVIDALSDYDFYATGSVDIPIPASDHVKPFIERGVEPLWTYYCVSQNKKVANRFFHMPSYRNRILGIQLYKFNAAGFLHWGYNFWNSQFSLYPIDPYKVTDAGCAFPSGDAFVVYPGEDGPVESLRLVVLHEALQDLRALRLLESMIGKEETLRLVEEGLTQAITFEDYPRDADWLRSLRERVNERIKSSVSGRA
ncbi:protein of unknown function [Cohnella sp. OV330]|uniref:DUF4091 domain-containing protein n=1 Tax=Cohnella sp. OV330 TaxID=1855288 RepID=UPI0008E277F1|nr:protein of unknown function [Cohnella sp. OV330]